MSKVAAELERVATLSPAKLRETWRKVYGDDAPLLSPTLLRMGLAYAQQEKAIGKLPARHARALRGSRAPVSAPTVTIGTQLVRSWNGRTISVVATDEGFTFEDRTYRSLSAIAREVTGTAWSGPRFFGLQDAARG
ncbi:MAG: DUF2924 domain-containing protein [Sphingobium sp.]